MGMELSVARTDFFFVVVVLRMSEKRGGERERAEKGELSYAYEVS